MKLLYFLLMGFIVINLTACSQKTFRTGTIYVTPFDIAGYKTSDPVDIREDVVKGARDNLKKEIERAVLENSRMQLATECARGGYKLTGIIDEVNVETQRRLYKSFREFEVEIYGKLIRCDNEQVLEDFSASKSKNDMADLLESLAEKIVKHVQYDNTIQTLNSK